jgi:hypothetical protein
VAVIISFVAHSSYDELFRKVEQKSEEGTTVLVYSCQSSYLPEMLKMVEKKEGKTETEKQLMKYIEELHADCVVFNWECSSGYGS